MCPYLNTTTIILPALGGGRHHTLQVLRRLSNTLAQRRMMTAHVDYCATLQCWSAAHPSDRHSVQTECAADNHSQYHVPLHYSHRAATVPGMIQADRKL